MMNPYLVQPYYTQKFNVRANGNPLVFYITAVISTLLSLFNVIFSVVYLFHITKVLDKLTLYDCVFWISSILFFLGETIFIIWCCICFKELALKSWKNSISWAFVIGLVFKISIIAFCALLVLLGDSELGKIVRSILIFVLIYIAIHLTVFSISMIELMVILNDLTQEYYVVFNGIY